MRGSEQVEREWLEEEPGGEWEEGSEWNEGKLEKEDERK